MTYRLLIALLWGIAIPLTLIAQQPAGIDPAVSARLDRGEAAEWLIVLRTRAALGQAARFAEKDVKGQFVFEQLREAARRSQAGVIRLLDRAGAPYQAFWVVNVIRTRGDAELAAALIRHPEVQALIPDPVVALERPSSAAPSLRPREDIEWGIRQIGAEQVWKLGFRGQGVVVAGQDTGYEWEHPALKEQYRGWNGSQADHNYHWHDAIRELNPLNNDSTSNPMNNPCGLDSPVPCDDDDHGTHTMGTMVGDDGQGNQIGLAPDARWIACRNMERGWGMLSTYLECFQWFLAPTDLQDENPDPARAPDVINNSWRCPGIEGCTPANWTLMEQAIDHVRAAGIVVVASAGNSGNACGTVNAPPAIFEGSFSVGATRSDDTIASFSSRGPVMADSSFRLKPDVAAPGVGVRSSVRGGEYASLSGTSMAGPHVAGLVALLLSANPELRGQVERIERILEETAKPMQDDQNCGNLSGQAVPNAVYGYGRVDALAAVERALELTSLREGAAGTPAVRVFPNPAGRRLFISGEDMGGPVHFRLFSSGGQLCARRQWSGRGAWMEALELDLPAGMYLYRLDTPRGSRHGKLLLR